MLYTENYKNWKANQMTFIKTWRKKISRNVKSPRKELAQCPRPYGTRLVILSDRFRPRAFSHCPVEMLGRAKHPGAGRKEMSVRGDVSRLRSPRL